MIIAWYLKDDVGLELPLLKLLFEIHFARSISSYSIWSFFIKASFYFFSSAICLLSMFSDMCLVCFFAFLTPYFVQSFWLLFFFVRPLAEFNAEFVVVFGGYFIWFVKSSLNIVASYSEANALFCRRELFKLVFDTGVWFVLLFWYFLSKSLWTIFLNMDVRAFISSSVHWTLTEVA